MNNIPDITLRDYFAITACQDDLRDYCVYRLKSGVQKNRTAAEARYAFADAMLKARTLNEE